MTTLETLKQALSSFQPFVLANSSEEFMTLIVRTADITKARKSITAIEAQIKELESVEPVGALVEVRKPDGSWQRYNIYDSVALAEDTKARTEGDGIEVRVVPLYRKEEV